MREWKLMSEPNPYEPKFHRLHYNLVAKRLRNHYPTEEVSALLKPIQNVQRRVIEDIALEFADRFWEDNIEFDAERFLDQCSPDPERFPFSELWEEFHGPDTR